VGGYYHEVTVNIDWKGIMTDKELGKLVRDAMEALDRVMGALLDVEHRVEMQGVVETVRAGKVIRKPVKVRTPRKKVQRAKQGAQVDLQEALEAHVAGVTVKELAGRYGVTTGWLYANLNALQPRCGQLSILARRQRKHEQALAKQESKKERYPYTQVSKVKDVGVARDLWLEGATLEELGRRYGVTREYVRQVVEQHYPGSGQEARRRRRERADEVTAQKKAQAQAEIQERVNRGEAPPCAVCGQPNLRALDSAKSLTCGEICAEAWPVLRYYLQPGYAAKHREAIARSTLKNPRSKPFERAHAQRVLDGTAPPYRRAGILPGSRAERFARRLRPDLLNVVENTDDSGG
jgi:hypothetical protein